MVRGQAALEFLATYGWAVVATLILIGATAYFGVLDPTGLIPDRCTLPPEFHCAEYKMDDAGVLSLGITNNIGVSLANATVHVDTHSCVLSIDERSNTSILNGQRIYQGGSNLLTFVCNPPYLGIGERFEGDVTVSYIISGDTVSHAVTGSINKKVERAQ